MVSITSNVPLLDESPMNGYLLRLADFASADEPSVGPDPPANDRR